MWAPLAERAEVRLLAPDERDVPMERVERGYHVAEVTDVAVGTTYAYRLDGGPTRADPASRAQPHGVDGPAQVVPEEERWSDRGWGGLSLEEYVMYELHVGTFTDAGTFDAAIEHLDGLRELGITAVELMPVAQFPGARNWGYDGVFPFAVQHSYGGRSGYARFVDACHARGLAVIQDVVYNHVGPEGNVLADFGPYFTDRYRTPWGDAINFDGPGSDEVRRFFLENASMWFEELRVDALRLDAIHGIVDASATPFLAELAEETRERSGRLGRPLSLIAESDLNDPLTVTPPERGGVGLDAQWLDDLHHAIHALLTGERGGYYLDFAGTAPLATSLRRGYVFAGEYSAYRDRRHGRPAPQVPAHRFVAFAQNHDQVGNRMAGERLGALVPFEALKLAGGLVLLSPFLPLLFMGEEHGERAPFQYFVSHSDPELLESVRRGRREEFAAFRWAEEPPDPGDEATFERSKVRRSLDASQRALRDLHAELLRLRRERPPLRPRTFDGQDVAEGERWLSLLRRHGDERALALFNVADEPAVVPAPRGTGTWRRVLDSAHERWAGPGASSPPDASDGDGVKLQPWAFALYEGA